VVEPVGYNTIWQKFENNVYQVIKKYFQDNDDFIVEWSPVIQRYCAGKVRTLTPDVLLSVKCKSCSEKKDDSNCAEGAFIFEAFCKFRDDRKYFDEKDDQMQKYAEICDSILVMPKGYEERPFCRKSNGKKTYYIISFEYIYQFLNSLKEAVEITYREDCCGDRPVINGAQVYRNFELSLRQSVDKCPACKQRVNPISLLYCSQYDEFSDIDFIEDTCIDCPNKQYFDECPFLSIELKFQCEKCGAIFDAESDKIIKNFDEGFFDLVLSEYSYYKEGEDENEHQEP
jgi:hypothetical protein